jgi:starch phosphorylase
MVGTDIPVVFLEDYDMDKAALLVQGVDLWLNNPIRPREASGTSGMKCALNGIPNFSVLDGWWIEGWVEGVTGWSIGPLPTETINDQYDDEVDLDDLLDKLEKVIIPTFYDKPEEWGKVMRGAIALNASYFNTHRVVREYCERAYGIQMRGL